MDHSRIIAQTRQRKKQVDISNKCKHPEPLKLGMFYINMSKVLSGSYPLTLELKYKS